MLIRDQAGRTARLLLYSGIFWLFVALAAGTGALLTAAGALYIQLPSGPAGVDLLQPVFLNTLVFGWLGMGGLGVGLLAIQRAHALTMAGEIWSQLAVWLWNAANAAGVVTLLLGWIEGPAWMEIWWPVKIALLVALVLLLLNVYRTLKRAEGTLYASAWYVVAALAWIVPLYLLGSGILAPGWPIEPLNALLYGVYTQGVVWLWAVPLALAAALYVAPDLSGQPLYSRSLAQWGLWGLVLFAGAGASRLAGSEMPAWAAALAASLAVLALIPTLAGATNIVMTVWPRRSAVLATPPGRALIWGTELIVLAGVQASLLPLSIIETAVRNTQWAVAGPLTALVGGCTFLLFAGIYHLLPMLRRPADRPATPLYGARAARWHLGLSGLGAVLYVAGLWLGGTAQVVERATYGSSANMAAAVWPGLMLQAAGLGVLLVAQLFLVYTVAKAANAPQPYKLPVILTNPR
ncbi:MAG: hypothetical protein BAA04_10860 [Firmicutes bacterium ZCTH02-B6]|nr:MAG: hypothetical protein BAA04_10860 [Firmicutes bacterium ZCTH02-B6]